MALTSPNRDWRPATCADRTTERTKRAALLVLVLAAVPLVMGQVRRDPAPRVVEAEKFLLRDAHDKVRAELAVGDDGPSLSLFDDRGRCRARLAVAEDGSSELSFYDDDGHRKAVFSVPPVGEPRLERGRGSERPRPASDERAADDRPSPEAAAHYRRLCQSCHGSDGRAARLRSRGSPIPDFTDRSWQAARSDAQLLISILDGRGDEMPPFDGQLNRRQAGELVAFVRAFAPGMPRRASAVGDDFESRFRQLEREWEELSRQIDRLPTARRRP